MTFQAFLSSINLSGEFFFNGRMAEKLYLNRILPALHHHFPCLDYQCLPSTSPAYASLTLEQKIEAWKVIKQDMVK